MKPTTFDFIYDEDSDAFEQTAQIDGEDVYISIDGFKKNEKEAATGKALEFLDWIAANRLKISDYIADGDLLELKNDAWLGDDEEELTAEDFKKRITKITSIGISYEDGFSIDFDDDDIFWGHSVVVSLDADFEFESAEMM